MAATRRKGLASSRRRQHDEGEEEEAGLDITSDSQSEASVLSDAEEAYNSDVSDVEEQEGLTPVKKEHADVKNIVHDKAVQDAADVPATSAAKDSAAGQPPSFEPTADTVAMMNGLKVEDAQGQDAIDFEDSAQLVEGTTGQVTATATASAVVSNKRETLAQRRAREHEEYKAKRENDPAFVPTRGGFFMHDQRNDAAGMNQHGAFGRGRGRGGPNGFLGPGRPLPANMKATPDKWSHDLHDSVAEPRTVDPRPSAATSATRQSATTQINFPSKTVAIGTVVVKILLPLAATAGKTVKLTVRQHTRLPDLRPPLRRDKPVRISLPGLNARYVFPSVERSFIFIPRTQRPNQQHGRPQSRLYNQSSSRRQSMFGGSTYAASAASRRSSVLQEAPPTAEAGRDTARPVVRLPGGDDADAPAEAINSSAVELAITQDHPPPAQPLRQEARRQSLPMHQPRPQKAVSVATIDSPSSMKPPQPQEQAPFHQQMPSHMAAGSNSATAEQRQSFQGQLPAMTPLSSIPEVAINAQPFQPTSMAGQQAYYPPQYPAPPMYYYQDGAQQQYPSIAYVPQGGYYVPIDQTASQPQGTEATSPAYAHESNGMVYYYPNQYMGGGEGQSYDIPPPQAQNGYYFPQDNSMMYYPAQ